MSWAVAWATKNALLEQVFEHADKIEMLAFGISFSQTDPDVLARLIGRSGCGFIDATSNETFHPKVYLFENGRSSIAIIGSSNFTNGGLSRNEELCVQLSGTSDDPVFLELRKQLDVWKLQIQPVTADFVDRYRVSYLAARKRMPQPKPNIWFGAKEDAPLLLSMDWNEFVDRTRREKTPASLDQSRNPLVERLQVLETAQTYFASARSFRDLDEYERKGIAGTFAANEDEKAFGKTGVPDWGWFGRMAPKGIYKSLICEKETRQAHPALVSAIDSIPIQGNIERANFEEFVMELKSDLPQVGIGLLTRLLAIKRPDTFVCICGGNEKGLSKALGLTVSDLKDISRYWQNVVEPMRNSKWYNTQRPSGEDGRIWDWRAAMADAVYYGK
jgi:PLD-like domain